MTVEEILRKLESYGDERTKKNHKLSMQLYQTGNSDAMYLAGLMGDEKQITNEHLESLSVLLEESYTYVLSLEPK